jgi:hypothetical protein
MLDGRYSIEGNYEPQAGLNDIFSQMGEILYHHSPEKEADYTPKGALPMVSVDQAAKELLEFLKNEANNNK